MDTEGQKSGISTQRH